MKKKFCILSFCFMMIISGYVYACNYHQGWDLVDGSNKIDWSGSTDYSSQWNYAVDEWNEMGEVTIQEDTVWTIKDLEIRDYTLTGSNTIAYTKSNGIMGFNKYHFDDSTFTSANKKNAMMHELGHALGIDHIDVNNNVMKNGKDSCTSLGTLDQSTYNCIWE